MSVVTAESLQAQQGGFRDAWRAFRGQPVQQQISPELQVINNQLIRADNDAAVARMEVEVITRQNEANHLRALGTAAANARAEEMEMEIQDKLASVEVRRNQLRDTPRARLNFVILGRAALEDIRKSYADENSKNLADRRVEVDRIHRREQELVEARSNLSRWVDTAERFGVITTDEDGVETLRDPNTTVRDREGRTMRAGDILHNMEIFLDRIRALEAQIEAHKENLKALEDRGRFIRTELNDLERRRIATTRLIEQLRFEVERFETRERAGLDRGITLKEFNEVIDKAEEAIVATHGQSTLPQRGEEGVIGIPSLRPGVNEFRQALEH